MYTSTLHQGRGTDRVHTVYSRSEESASGLASDFNLPRYTTNMKQAVEDPDTDVVVMAYQMTCSSKPSL